jgi:hypothetical protein
MKQANAFVVQATMKMASHSVQVGPERVIRDLILHDTKLRLPDAIAELAASTEISGRSRSHFFQRP